MAKKKEAPKSKRAKKAPVAAIRIREEEIVHNRRRSKPSMMPLTNEQMMADTFNVIHARISLNDGLTLNKDVTETRERLFEIISTRGWESTFKILASCARLFAEVPAPLPNLTKFSKDHLHSAAQALDAKAMELRFVDREATKGHQI